MDARPCIRLDKWLFHARFFKTRSLSARIVTAGGVRINGTRVSKPSASLCEGDTLTFAKDQDIRVVRVIALGERRGPAPEAQALYEDQSPPPRERPSGGPRFDKGGRPTKKDRRDMTRDREG